MKNLIYICITICIITSCSKEEITQVNCIEDICIDGEWEWVESYGSIAGITITPNTEMITRKLLITETNYQEFVNEEMIVDTEYEYVKSDELKGFTNDSLILKLSTGNWFAIFEENERLILFEPCFDCWEHTYERK